MITNIIPVFAAVSPRQDRNPARVRRRRNSASNNATTRIMLLPPAASELEQLIAD